MCDVPDYCAEGTDDHDCARSGAATQCEDDLAWLDRLGFDCSSWARNPGWCVDEMYPPSSYANATGADATEVCCVCGGSSTGRFSSDAGGGGYSYADSCAFANDGMCDEPYYCLLRTDTTDCDANPSSGYGPYGYSYGYGSYDSVYGSDGGNWYFSNGAFGGDDKGHPGCLVQNLLIFKDVTPLSLMHACKY